MTIADMVCRQVQMLPEPQGRDPAEWRDLMQAQATGLASVWDNAEDEVWNYVCRPACKKV